ncbi:MAG: hypothetical protein VX781_16150, partial [Pseudomonadota bacterium]|nr:hypothetical protein [Pseudomonadota bacterium]
TYHSITGGKLSKKNSNKTGRITQRQPVKIIDAGPVKTVDVLYLPEFPTLMNSEYQMFPRGRVLFEKRCATFKIFADSTIIKNKYSRKLIIDAFSLQDEKCKWKRDTHYAVF